MSNYQTFKFWLQDYLHLAKDALHIHIGLAIFFGAVLLFRWPVRSWRPLLLVVAIAFAGEIWDLRDTLRMRTTIPWSGQAKDLVNTILWPAILMLLARYSRVLSRR